MPYIQCQLNLAAWMSNYIPLFYVDVITDLVYLDGFLPKGPYPPCLRMADRAFLAGYPQAMPSSWRLLCPNPDALLVSKTGPQ